MPRIIYPFLVLLVASITSCETDMQKFKYSFSLSIDNPQSEWKMGDTVNLTLSNANDIAIDSVVWTENARVIPGAGGITLSRKLTNQPLGELTFKAHAYKDGRSISTKASIKRFNNKAPKILKYEVVNTYPHLKESYTQGLEFHGDSLYESTGQFRQSDIRITNVETGEVIKKVKLPDSQFAEGLTILNDKVYQLTWQSQIGYVYDLGLNQLQTFAYNNSKQGWGLTNDGEKLYKSDGTDKIWIIDPATFKEEGYIQVVTNKKIFSKINEMEYIDGKIYANIYTENAIMIIDPKSGALESLIYLKPLIAEIPNYTANDNVLNGIAYDKKNDRLFVTGKRWEKMFEIKIVE
ncbi:MAG: glutaminyl-peptide cyclotransferase [Nonlabens sp.]